MKLDGEDLIWEGFSNDYADGWPRYMEDTEGALDAFLAIEDGAGVQSFARRFGPLSLCVHLLPQSHQQGGCRPTRREPVFRWLELVRVARAIINIASQMRRSLHGRREDWEELYASHLQADGQFPEEFENLIRSLSGETNGDSDWNQRQWMELKWALDWWIRIADVRPALSIHWGGPDRPQIELAAEGTWGVLSVQLLAAVAGAHEVVFCQACGAAYVPDRQPQRGRRYYCGRAECKAFGARLRKRDQRARDHRRR